MNGDSPKAEPAPGGNGPSQSVHPPPPEVFGTVTVGERGQVVIPQAARERLGITGGDKLLVMQGLGGAPGLFFIKTEVASEILATAVRHLADLEVALGMQPDDRGAPPDSQRPPGQDSS